MNSIKFQLMTGTLLNAADVGKAKGSPKAARNEDMAKSLALAEQEASAALEQLQQRYAKSDHASRPLSPLQKRMQSGST